MTQPPNDPGMDEIYWLNDWIWQPTKKLFTWSASPTEEQQKRLDAQAQRDAALGLAAPAAAAWSTATNAAARGLVAAQQAQGSSSSASSKVGGITTVNNRPIDNYGNVQANNGYWYMTNQKDPNYGLVYIGDNPDGTGRYVDPSVIGLDDYMTALGGSDGGFGGEGGGGGFDASYALGTRQLDIEEQNNLFNQGLASAQQQWKQAMDERDFALAEGNFKLAQQKQASADYWEQQGLMVQQAMNAADNAANIEQALIGANASMYGSQTAAQASIYNAQVDAAMQRESSRNQLQANLANAINDADRNKAIALFNQEQAAIAKMEDDTKRLLGVQQNQIGLFGAETDRANVMGNLAQKQNEFILNAATSPRDLMALYFMQRGITPDWEAIKNGTATATGTPITVQNALTAYVPQSGLPTIENVAGPAYGTVGSFSGSYQASDNPYISMGLNANEQALPSAPNISYSAPTSSYNAGAYTVNVGSAPKLDTSLPLVDINPAGFQGGIPVARLKPGMNLTTVGSDILGSDIGTGTAYYDANKTKAVGATDNITGGTQIYIDYPGPSTPRQYSGTDRYAGGTDMPRPTGTVNNQMKPGSTAPGVTKYASTTPKTTMDAAKTETTKTRPANPYGNAALDFKTMGNRPNAPVARPTTATGAMRPNAIQPSQYGAPTGTPAAGSMSRPTGTSPAGVNPMAAPQGTSWTPTARANRPVAPMTRADFGMNTPAPQYQGMISPAMRQAIQDRNDIEQENQLRMEMAKRAQEYATQTGSYSPNVQPQMDPQSLADAQAAWAEQIRLRNLQLGNNPTLNPTQLNINPAQNNFLGNRLAGGTDMMTPAVMPWNPDAGQSFPAKPSTPITLGMGNTYRPSPMPYGQGMPRIPQPRMRQPSPGMNQALPYKPSPAPVFGGVQPITTMPIGGVQPITTTPIAAYAEGTDMMRYAGGMPGYTRAPQMMVGDAAHPNPWAQGAKPEIIENPTGAPIRVKNTYQTMADFGMAPRGYANAQAPLGMPRQAIGTDASQAYADAGFGSLYIPGSDNSYMNSWDNIPTYMQGLKNYETPIAPAIGYGATGRTMPTLNGGLDFTQSGGGTLASAQTLNNMTQGEQELYRSYVEGTVGKRWSDIVDSITKGTQNLGQASRGRTAFGY